MHQSHWEQTELGRDWVLLEEEGELVGYKYNTREVGEIDLLARHRTDSRWLSQRQIEAAQATPTGIDHRITYRR